MYRKILVTLDGSELSECVLPHVEAFRKGFPNCEVTLIQIVKPVYDTFPVGVETISPEQWRATEKSIAEAAGNYLKGVMDRLEKNGGPVRSEVLIGRVHERIVDYAEEQEVDLIIMATHGRSGVSRLVMGSVADRVLRSARVPVLMVRAPGTGQGP